MKKRNKKQAAPKKKNWIIGLVTAIFILLIIAVFFLKTNKNNAKNIIENKTCFEDNQDWINENCECIDYEGGRIFCPDGYELDGELCRQGNKLTNTLQACSKYKCEFEVEK